MKYFDKKTTLLILVFCIPLIFIPKFNLIKFSKGETAGIRIDDIILLGAGFLLFWAHYALRKKTPSLEKWMFILVAFSLFSFFLNRFFVSIGMLHVHAKIFYCVRLMEYFIFFYIGALAFNFCNVSSVIRIFILFNLSVMILQKMSLVGELSVDGYHPISNDRVIGIASFPSEMGAMLNLIFCFLVYDKEYQSKFFKLLPIPYRKFIEKTYVYLYFLLFSFFIVITGSRMCIVTLLICFLFRIKEDFSLKSPGSIMKALSFCLIGGFLILFFVQELGSLVHRSKGLISYKNVELVQLVWDNIILEHDPLKGESVPTGDYDMSWWMRIHKWCYAAKIYYLHPECYLQGIGPGFAMAGLDGGILRILTEYGLIGCFIFWKLFSKISSLSKTMKWMMVTFWINMIFFDVYLAYKPMIIIFFVAGYTYSKRYEESQMFKYFTDPYLIKE